MGNFIVELWESVFQPGTTPALIMATHASFALLMVSLLVMIYLSRSIHFVNLTIIACCLWAAVTWFICEIEKEKAKLKSNNELIKESEGNDDGEINKQVGSEKDANKKSGNADSIEPKKQK